MTIKIKFIPDDGPAEAHEFSCVEDAIDFLMERSTKIGTKNIFEAGFVPCYTAGEEINPNQVALVDASEAKEWVGSNGDGEAECPNVPEAVQDNGCVCGEGERPGVVHRKDGPCQIEVPKKKLFGIF